MKKHLLRVVSATLGVVLFTAYPLLALAAVAFDSAGSGSTGAGKAKSLTVSFTNTAGNFLVVQVADTQENVTGCSGTSVTWNGTAMTELDDRHNVGGTMGFATYYLLNAVTGTHNIVATLTGCSADARIALNAASYSGASTIAIDDTAQTQNTSGTTNLSTSVTTTQANSWSIALAMVFNRTVSNNTNVGNTRSTLSFNDTDTGANTNFLIGDGGTIASPGAYTQSVDFSGNSGENNLRLIAIKTPEAAGGVTPILMSSVF